MSGVKHTPGPWGIAISISNLGFVEVRDKDGLGKNILASVGGNCLSHHAGSPVMPDEALANARLVAAAPDLLAACEAALKGVLDPDARKQMKAAVAKAKGQP
jgi:hypothetical protein